MKTTEYVSISKLNQLMKIRSWVVIENPDLVSQNSFVKLVSDTNWQRTEVFTLADNKLIGVFE